jgi:hypothetical protein
MTVNIVGNSGMKQYEGSVRFVFDGHLFPLEFSVQELYEKLTKDNPLALQDKVELKIQFNQFWEKYKRKEKKDGAWKIWQKLTVADRNKIMETIDQFVLANPDVKFRPMATSYLNGKRWLDDVDDVKKVIEVSWAKRNTWKD